MNCYEEIGQEVELHGRAVVIMSGGGRKDFGLVW